MQCLIDQKRVSDLLKLGLQTVVSALWVLETKEQQVL